MTDNQKAQIIKLRAAGNGYGKIAKTIGISVNTVKSFCGRTKETYTDEWMQSVVDYDILPMLQEYWFDDDSKVQRWDNILHGVFQ